LFPADTPDPTTLIYPLNEQHSNSSLLMYLYKSVTAVCIFSSFSLLKSVLNAAKTLLSLSSYSEFLTHIILGCAWNTPVRHMTEELDWLMVEENVYLDVMTLIYKIDKGLTPTYLRLTPRLQDVHNHLTRNRLNLTTWNQKGATKSLFLEGISEYNRIQNCQKVLKTLRTSECCWLKS